MRSTATSQLPGADGDRLKPRGSSQGGLRQYNERVVLQAIRLHGALPGAEIARVTQLTAQTICLITKRLDADGLLLRGAPQRGKVGQPSVPLWLNPDGALAIGIKVGRRSLDVLLVDFAGAVRQRWTADYRYPEPDALLAEIARAPGRHPAPAAARPNGAGAGRGHRRALQPGRLADLAGHAAPTWPHAGRTPTCAPDVAALTELPVTLVKDTAAACVAELVAGRGRSVQSFLYVFVDTFIGGGLVLDSQLRAGLHGNAGAIGSLPMALAGDGPGPAAAAERGLAAEPGTALWPAPAWTPAPPPMTRALQAPWLPHTQAWLADAAAAMALAVNSAACLLDLESVIVDGSFSRPLQAALVASAAAGHGPLQLGGRHPPGAAAGQHRLGRAGPGRRPAAAARQLLARPRTVLEDRRRLKTGRPGSGVRRQASGVTRQA